MKRLIASILILILALSLAACGGSAGGGGNSPGDTASTGSAPPSTPDEPPSTGAVVSTQDTPSPDIGSETPATTPAAVAPVVITDYKAAAKLAMDIAEALNAFYGQAAAKFGQTHGKGDPDYIGNVVVLMLNSIGLAITASLSDDPADLTVVETVAKKMYNAEAKATINAPNDYTVSIGDDVVYNCAFDPEHGSLRMTYVEKGKIKQFYEFVPLGEGEYAFRTETEKAVVAYNAGKIQHFSYTSNSSAADFEPGSIYPSGEGSDAVWVISGGVESYTKCIIFDGKTILVDAKPINGNRINVSIPVS